MAYSKNEWRITGDDPTTITSPSRGNQLQVRGVSSEKAIQIVGTRPAGYGETPTAFAEYGANRVIAGTLVDGEEFADLFDGIIPGLQVTYEKPVFKPEEPDVEQQEPIIKFDNGYVPAVHLYFGKWWFIVDRNTLYTWDELLEHVRNTDGTYPDYTLLHPIIGGE